MNYEALLYILIFILPISVVSTYCFVANKPKKIYGLLIVLVPHIIGLFLIYKNLI
ncbi:hypothetical protein ACNSOL_00100 [Aliarcobacter lanthieri]|uniref:hypothetical protein n=1 Tax=Aliarcobacter lanthieri TaxID=1355374 RepID=UPI003AAA90E1